MVRASAIALLAAMIVGCRTIEREGAIALPENAAPLSYSEMILRARGQAGAALDAFYLDAWLDLEQAAQRLEQTARLLPKATHVPETFKAKVEPDADALRQDALKLMDAARAKNSAQANETMQRINQRIRQMRPREPFNRPPADEKSKPI
jgi:hypothetical protein